MSHIVSDSNIIITGNTRVSNNYSFNASTKLVTVNDKDFNKVVSIINQETNDVLYNIGDPSLSGTIYNTEVLLDFDTTSMDDSDTLFILYEAIVVDNIERLLQKQIDNQKQIIKLLSKIYNPI